MEILFLGIFRNSLTFLKISKRIHFRSKLPILNSSLFIVQWYRNHRLQWCFEGKHSLEGEFSLSLLIRHRREVRLFLKLRQFTYPICTCFNPLNSPLTTPWTISHALWVARSLFYVVSRRIGCSITPTINWFWNRYFLLRVERIVAIDCYEKVVSALYGVYCTELARLNFC